MTSKSGVTAIAIEEEKATAERINGWAAMLGFVAAMGAYVTTGQIIPGVF